MPSDKNGKPLSAGDLVNVACRVISVAEIDDNDNLTLETVELFYPQSVTRHLSLNAKQVTLITDAEKTQADRIAELEAEVGRLKETITKAEALLGSDVATAASTAIESGKFAGDPRFQWAPPAAAPATPAAPLDEAAEAIELVAAEPPSPTPPPVAEAATEVDGNPPTRPGLYKRGDQNIAVT